MQKLSAILYSRFTAHICAMAVMCAANTALAHPLLEVKTNYGSFEIELHEDRTPKTVANFLTYVREGFYRDTLMHRLVPNTLLQGGRYSTQWAAKPAHAPIPNEAATAITNRRWTLAMGHAAQPDSATSEFFINLNDNEDFDFRGGGAGAYYCVFGEVIKGTDTIKKMIEAGVMAGGDFIGDQPMRDLIIQDITIITEN